MTLWTHLEAETATLGKASHAFSISGLSIDTRTLKEGDLFVALKGDNRDGHDFVRAAFEAKAAAALVAHAPKGATGPLLTVGHTQRGLEDLARAARARSHAKILAVTGSAARTTMCAGTMGSGRRRRRWARRSAGAAVGSPSPRRST